MDISYVIQALFLVVLCIKSTAVFKAGYDEKVYFNYAMVWSMLALMAFCVSVMFFVLKGILVGTLLAAVFLVSMLVAMKFRNAGKLSN